MLKEKEAIEGVRNMTEEERMEWDRKNPKPALRPKLKWRFMQKYYHKGAFFQADPDDRSATAGSDDIFNRDFSSPTGEDKMNKTNLPKVMQVMHFGCSGRTKWTHLVNEDTTDWSNPWTYNDPLWAKYNAKMAGMNAPISKPKVLCKLVVSDLHQDEWKANHRLLLPVLSSHWSPTGTFGNIYHLIEMSKSVQIQRN